MAHGQKVSTCLWFDTEAETATRFYVSLFEGSITVTAITVTVHLIDIAANYGDSALNRHSRPPGPGKQLSALSP